MSQTRTQIERMYISKLDEVLSSQKTSSDKNGLGFVLVGSFDPSTFTSSGSRTVFIPETMNDPRKDQPKVDKGKKVIGQESSTKINFIPPSRKPNSPRAYIYCNQCGAAVHIRLNCYKLKASMRQV